MGMNIEETRTAQQEWCERSLREWHSVVQPLFSSDMPAFHSWSGTRAIADVLNQTVCKIANHMLYPRGGGMDLREVIPDVEPDCIELVTDGIPVIVRPDRLILESVGNDANGIFFRLETSNLRPSPCYPDERTHEPWSEEVTRLGPSEYAPRSIGEQGYLRIDEHGNRVPLPRHAGIVARISGGRFVIFAKGSIYNQDTRNYDGKHDKLSPDAFRELVAAGAC